MSYKRALLIGAHPDDVELGAAGLALKLRKAGGKLYYVAFSKCEADSGLDFTGEQITRELNEACKVMDVADVFILNYPNTRLPEYAREIRSFLGELQRSIHPDLVLIPSLSDPHQDHKTVAEESLRTFRTRETILSYELHRHGSYRFQPNVFADITSVIDEKVRVLNCYQSQLKRPYFSEDIFRSIARMRGAQVGIYYAEAFEAVKIFYV